MSVLLFVLACLAIFFSVITFAISQSAIHEILAAVIGVSACVLLGCAFIVDAVNKVEEKLKEPDQ